jgi:phosphoribosylglycinamide formyltransferase-1
MVPSIPAEQSWYRPRLMRVAVLASGSGTLLEAILADGIPVDLVVVDRPCRVTEVAAAHGVAEVLRSHGIVLVVMAGWGTIFGQPMFDAFPNRILNTHPALLPSFKGWHAVPDALAYGVKVTGCTVHVATLEVDDGPILAQEAVSVLADDDVDSLHERIKKVERSLFPATIWSVLADPGQLDLPTSKESS